MSSLGNKTIEGIEYYQDTEKNNKVIVHYKENNRIYSVVVSVVKNIDNENLEKLKNIDKKELVGKTILDWINENKVCFEIQKQINIAELENQKLYFKDITDKNVSIRDSSNKLFSIKDNNITIFGVGANSKESLTTVSYVYLNLEHNCIVYERNNNIFRFYSDNSTVLSKLIGDNNINDDFFIRVALNKAVINFIKKENYEAGKISAD